MSPRLLRRAAILLCPFPIVVACSAQPGEDVGATEHALDDCDRPASVTSTLNLTRSGLGSGTVSDPTAGACAPPCALSSSAASAVLTATPSAGSVFAGWGGDCLTSGSAPCSLALGQARNVQAIFTRSASSGKVFDDVPTWHPQHAFINLLQEKAVTGGTSSSPPLFSPDAPVTRGQMAVFIIRARNLARPEPTRGLRGGSPDNFDAPATPYFTDVPAGHPFFKHVQKLRELGITSGYGDGRFGVDDPLEAWQAAVFVTRAALGDDFTFRAQPLFWDMPSTHLAFKYVQKMAEDGIECGCGWGSYCASATVTRAQMAMHITRRFFGAPRCGAAACSPTTSCQAQGKQCGSLFDGCSTVSCGTCAAGETCQDGRCQQQAYCGNGTCDPGEDGSTCGQDCCDWHTPCGQTYRNQGQRYCRDLRVGYQWRGYRWVTEQEAGWECDQSIDAETQNLAVCGQGQAFVCCWPNGTWVSGLSCR